MVNFETSEQPPPDQKQVSRITVDHGEMVKKTSIKSKFSQLNDKRFYFPEGVVSQPFGHPNLKEIDEFKKQKGQKIEKYFWEEKEYLFNLELKALKNHHRLYLYNQILMPFPKLFNIGQKNDFTQQKKTLLKGRHKRYNFRGKMDNEINYMCDAKFEWKILVVGRNGCDKTIFVQNLGKNQMFGDIKEVLWISKISLSTEREDNIRDCFANQQVHFEYPINIDEFEDLLEIYKRKKRDCKENVLGENIVVDRLVVMDDVSGLAERSETFSKFLTGLTCVYVFYTVYLGRQNWQMIISQTKMFNIFPGSVEANTIIGIISSFCTRYRYNYIPKRDLLINRLYFDISNSGTKQCLTIDTRDINDLGSAKFRTQADSNNEQVCYYNRNKKDNNFNSFLAVRK